MEGTENKVSIEELIKILSIASIYLTLLGLFILNSFYATFDFHLINKYIDFSEVLISVFGASKYFQLPFISAFLIIPLVLHLNIEEKFSFRNFMKTIAFIVMLDLVIACLIVSLIYRNSITLDKIAFSSIVVIIFFTAQSLISNFSKKHWKLLEIQYHLFTIKTIRIIVYVCFFSCFIFVNNKITALAIKEKNIYKGTTIHLQEETIITNGTLIYVDSQKNYTFLFNRKENQMVVIPNSSISKIIFNQKNFKSYLDLFRDNTK